MNGHTETQQDADYSVNGHEFHITEEYDEAEQIQCRECLTLEVIQEDEDATEYLELMTPECRIEWLREPDDGFHGVALRNSGYFSGRQLIGVREGGKLGEGEVVDTIRIYDEDAGQLTWLLDKQNWEGHR